MDEQLEHEPLVEESWDEPSDGPTQHIPEDMEEGRVRKHYCSCPKVLASSKVFTVILCIYAIIEGAIVSGFSPVVLSPIEKRYHFSSTQASFIISTFDFAVVLSVVFISYFGDKGHKPRWLGASVIIQGLGAFVFALPQFIFGTYQVGSDAKFQLEACHDHYNASCDNANNYAYAFFVSGKFLIGIGAAALYTLGTSYLDDIVHPKYVSIHLGVFYACSVIGPAIGFGLGGGFLSVYVDPWKSTDLQPSDPGWVGAWWLCFVFAGVVSILLSIPLLMFPQRLPDTQTVTEARKKEMANTYVSKYAEEKKFGIVLKTFPTHLRKLFGTPSWLFVSLGVSALFFSLGGMVAFAPKYIESTFGLSASAASLTAGAVAIPAGLFGVLSGATIMYCLKSRGKNVGKKGANVNWVVAILAAISTLIFLGSCSNLKIAGINTNYTTGPAGDDVLMSPCNQPCNCSSSTYEPVCGADNLTYFSPCRAGCDKRLLDGDTSMPVFENCSCIPVGFAQSNTTTAYLQNESMLLYHGTATDGVCDRSCNQLGLFAAGIGVLLYLIFMLKIPTTLVTLRCVADEQRALALGVQSVVFRIFGSIPGPIVFGVIFDSACIYWQYECGERGHCWVYDNDNLKLRAFAMGLAGLGLNVVLSFTAWALYPSSGLSLENGVLGADSPDERSLLPLQDAEKEENCSVQEDEEEEEEMTTL